MCHIGIRLKQTVSKRTELYHLRFSLLPIQCILLFFVSIVLDYFRSVLAVLLVFGLLISYLLVRYSNKRLALSKMTSSYTKSLLKDLKAAFDILSVLVICFLLYFVLSVLVPFSSNLPQEWIFSNRVAICILVFSAGIIFVFLSSLKDHGILSFRNMKPHVTRSYVKKANFLEYWSENLAIVAYGLVIIPGISYVKRFPLEVTTTALFVALVVVYWHRKNRTMLRKLRNVILLGLVISQPFYIIVGAYEVQREDFETLVFETMKGLEDYAQYTNYVGGVFSNLSESMFACVDYITENDKRVALYLDKFYANLENAEIDYQKVLQYCSSAKTHFSAALEMGRKLQNESAGITLGFVTWLARLANVLDQRLWTIKKSYELYLLWVRCMFETDNLAKNFTSDAKDILNELKYQDETLAGSIYPFHGLAETGLIHHIRITTESRMQQMLLATSWNLTYERFHTDESLTKGWATLSLSNPTERTFLFYFIEIGILPETKYEFVDLFSHTSTRINNSDFLESVGIDPSFLNPSDPFTWLPVEAILEPGKSLKLDFILKCNLTDTSSYTPLIYVHYDLFGPPTESGQHFSDEENWFFFRLPSDIITQCH